ncbi:Gfo/Idh/MocA family oxidoreductase [Nonomuraea sp. NPDC026600]|uniref:Gfo/Idh/MocA family protein n=1 Tax=Nonomuraea sp. NPDC026600 TaxID=3155363 RepID=UPI0033FE9A6E
MRQRPIRWGVLGTGHMAQVFTEDLLRMPGHHVMAVGSRNSRTAQAFAQRHNISRAYGSYTDLAADDEIDVIYVATPNNTHYSAGQTCLQGGRAIVMEKPFTVTAEQAQGLISLARERRVFAMEAMWMRFNPVIRRLRELVSDGAIGEVTALYADFCFAPAYDPNHRVWAPELAGGALLDLGVYPLSLAWMLLGQPDDIRTVSSPAATGVDANTAVLLHYRAGAIALLHCGLLAQSTQTATVIGTTGRIDVAPPFFRPRELTLHRDGRRSEAFAIELVGHGYTYQAAEVAHCLRSGSTESSLMPLHETLAILRILDAVRDGFTNGPHVIARAL